MRVNLNLVVGTVAIVATGVILFMVFKKGKTIAAAAGAVVDAVNPASPSNIFAQGADKLTQIFTGEPALSFGSFLYDKFANDTSGKSATTPSVPSNVINIQDYWRTVAQDDQDAGEQARIAVAFDDGAFTSNEGGAPFGNPMIMRQGVRYGAVR